MAINVSVQYNGFLPDIILLTLGYYHRGTHLDAVKRFRLCSLLRNNNFVHVVESPYELIHVKPKCVSLHEYC